VRAASGDSWRSRATLSTMASYQSWLSDAVISRCAAVKPFSVKVFDAVL
jgi:hypothetical protein